MEAYPTVVYPLPLDNWETFKPDVVRFTDSWRKYPPGYKCVLMVMCCKDNPNPDQEALFHDLPVRFERYDGDGCDIGSHQAAAKLKSTGFIVGVSTRVFFHRAGWLNHLWQARKENGRGLYGTAVSYETGRIHFRTHCYGMDAEEWHNYPVEIDSRPKGLQFENGADDFFLGSLLEWAECRDEMATWCVYWDGVWDGREWFKRPNIFRAGNQENLLVWDRHIDLYARATDKEKQALHDMTFYGGLH